MMNINGGMHYIVSLFQEREETTVMKDAADCRLLLFEPSAWFLVGFSFV